MSEPDDLIKQRVCQIICPTCALYTGALLGHRSLEPREVVLAEARSSRSDFYHPALAREGGSVESRACVSPGGVGGVSVLTALRGSGPLCVTVSRGEGAPAPAWCLVQLILGEEGPTTTLAKLLASLASHKREEMVGNCKAKGELRERKQEVTKLRRSVR